MQAAGLTAYRNWQPLLEDPSIEVLHVATPPHVRGHHQLPAAVAAYVFVSERKAPLTTDAVRKIG